MTADIFVAQSSPEDAIVGPLKTITYVTSDAAGTHQLFTSGMDMEASDWMVPAGEEKERLSAYFGLSAGEDWRARSYSRSGAAENLQIRIILVGDHYPQVRPKINGAYLGGLSIGFPMADTDAREAQMTKAGFPSIIGVKRLEFASPSGETYVSEEVHFTGPENIYVLGVKRPDIFVPVGPLDGQIDVGAPAYSAICVDDCDAAKSFYSDVLGYEFRRDMAMTVGGTSGLDLREGSDERFIQAFAPGANTGYLVFLDHGEDRRVLHPKPNFGPPSRGLTMWSFPSKDLAQVHERALAYGAEVMSGPSASGSPFLPSTETLMLRDPSGYPVEIYAL